MAKSLREVEYEYYLTTSEGPNPNAPLSELKRSVLCQYGELGDATRKPLSQLEMEAIHKYGNTTSQTPPYDAWVAALQVNGTAIPVGASLDHIKYLFYSNGGFL
jgi:hypothetical protein